MVFKVIIPIFPALGRLDDPQWLAKMRPQFITRHAGTHVIIRSGRRISTTSQYQYTQRHCGDALRFHTLIVAKMGQGMEDCKRDYFPVSDRETRSL